MFKTAIFLRDLTRPQDISSTYNWFISLVRDLLPSEVEKRDCTGFHYTQELYQSTGFPCEVSSWPKLFSKGHPKLYSLLNQMRVTGNELFLGYEIAPSILAYFEEQNIPYINFYLHPIRFLPDVYFELQTNVPHIKDALALHLISADEIQAHAASLRASFSREETLPWNNLFVGQTEVDRSLIDGEKYTQFTHVIPRLPKDLVYKPHPYNRSAVPHGATVTHINIYQILSRTEHLNIYSLSSSVLEEAQWFNHKAHRLVTSPSGHRGQPHRHPYLHASFWGGVFRGTITHPQPLNLPPNLMRNTFRAYWGYEAIHFPFLYHTYGPHIIPYLPRAVMQHAWKKAKKLIFG